MSSIETLPTPALLLDLAKLESNLDAMAAKCQRLGVALRPHIKTHKSPKIGRMQLERGAQGITVATLYEAKQFAAEGFDDITWAFPIPLSRVDEALEVSRGITLRLVVDSSIAIDALENRSAPLDVLLKVDCGYHRVGVKPASTLALELARRLAESATLRFNGILTHSGQSYSACGKQELGQVADHEREVMAAFAADLRAAGIDVPVVSIGSTPAMSAVENLEGVTEARPGNYAFYDATQVEIGSCSVQQCAVTVLTSVVSSGQNHSILDAGALALSKDPGRSGHRRPNFGCGFHDYTSGSLDPRLRVFSLSQEHGWLTGSHPVGTQVRLLPQHSCLTVAQFDQYTVVRGDEVIGRWPIPTGRD